MKAIAFGALGACVALSAYAGSADPVASLTAKLKSQVPAKWETHVRWRDGGMLLATITPWPYQEAFELWYDQAKLRETLASFCPKAEDQVWGLLTPEQDIVLEPTVGGKTGVEARLSCRSVANELATSH